MVQSVNRAINKAEGTVRSDRVDRADEILAREIEPRYQKLQKLKPEKLVEALKLQKEIKQHSRDARSKISWWWF